MLIYEEASFDHGTADFTFSLLKKRFIIIDDGIKHYIGEPIRMAVVPGDIKRVEEFAPQLVPMFISIWTPEVVKVYKELRAEDEARMSQQNEQSAHADDISLVAMFARMSGESQQRRKSVSEILFGAKS